MWRLLLMLVLMVIDETIIKDMCLPESSEFGPDNLAIHRPPTVSTFFTLPAGALGWRSSQTRRVKCRRACVTTHQSTTCTPDHTESTTCTPTTHRARVTTQQSTTCTPDHTQGTCHNTTEYHLHTWPCTGNVSQHTRVPPAHQATHSLTILHI